MTKFRRGLRSQLEDAKRANDMYADLAGKPRLDYSAHLKPKRERALTVREVTVPSEHQSQAAVISWWALQCGKYGLPIFALFAIPNGGARDMITGARLKAEGVRPGIPDLMLALWRGNYAGLFIEMKKPKNYPSTVQHDVITYLHEAGYACKVAYSTDTAIETIKQYLRGDEL